jgi:DNA repair exonuclease SbcCD ATPase subunit
MNPVSKTTDEIGKRPTESISTGKDALIALALALGLSQKVAAIVVGAFAALPFLVSYIVDLRRAAKR